MSKKDRFIVTTPIVELGYAYLRTPDTAFNKDGGDYKADFFMSPAQAKEFCAMIENDARALVKGKRSKMKFTKVNGQIRFKSKQHAVITTKRNGKEEQVEMKPRMFHIVDGKTVPYPDDAPTPFAGTKAELELEIVPFDGFGGGLSLRLRGLRLHEIVAGATSSGSSAWGEVEDGYTSGTKDYEKTENPASSEDGFGVDDDEEDEDGDDDRW